MPRKPDEKTVECYGHGSLIAAKPHGGTEHYGNWRCVGPRVGSLRERWRCRSVSRQELGQLGYGTEMPFNTSTVSKPTINLLSFTMSVLNADARVPVPL